LNNASLKSVAFVRSVISHLLSPAFLFYITHQTMLIRRLYYFFTKCILYSDKRWFL